MDFNIQLYVNGEKNSIRLKDAPEDVAAETIHKFFSVIQPFVAVETIAEPVKQLYDPKQAAADVKAEIDRMIEADKKQESKTLKKKLPIVGQENRSSFSMEDLLSEEEPSYFKTGIKEDESGRKRYKVRYECEECGHRANHYIPSDVDTVKCHECDEVMFVEKAIKELKDGEPQPNDFGNFYVAGELIKKIS